VLLGKDADALWVTSAPIAKYVQHEWAGAWMCSCFRNEGSVLSSELITEAVRCTRWKYGDPPEMGFVTFVDRAKTRSKRDPGYCYLMAGWEPLGRTQGGLYALGLSAEALRGIEPIQPRPKLI
jgi:hypothetical protein